MPLSIQCDCGCSYRVPESAAGKRFRCKKCTAAIRVPKSKHAARLEPAADDRLHQLFDDDDDAVDQPPPRRTQVRRSANQFSVEPEYESDDEQAPFRTPKPGPLSITAILGAAALAVAFSHPPLAGAIIKTMFVISGGFILLGYAWLVALARRESLAYALFCGICPPFLLIYAALHWDEARDAFIWVAIGLVFAIVTAGLGLALESLHGMPIV